VRLFDSGSWKNAESVFSYSLAEVCTRAFYSEIVLCGVYSTRRARRARVVLEGTGKDPWGGERAGFSASTSIDRREFGLQWNKALETGGVLVGDKVELTLEVETVKQAAQKVA
jgi:hypothetical protein